MSHRVKIQNLLELAEQPTVPHRGADGDDVSPIDAQMAETITNFFRDYPKEMSDTERTMMYDALRLLLKECETSVRQMLSKYLAECPDVPDEIIHSIINDEAEVAFPILSHSELLKDKDLIDILHRHTTRHRLAIAIRKDLSEQVTAAIVDTDDTDAIVKTLENKTAKFCRNTISLLVNKSEFSEKIQPSLITRPELTPEFAQKMMLWVSDAMLNHITTHYNIDGNILNNYLENMALETYTHDFLYDSTKKEVFRLSAVLKNHHNITPHIIVRTLEFGEVDLFLDLLREKTGLDKERLTDIINNPGGEGLAIVCRATSMEKNQFVRVFALCRKVFPAKGIRLSEELRGVLEYYNDFTTDTARHVIERWKEKRPSSSP